MFHEGRVIKLGPGHYRIVHAGPHRKPNDVVVDIAKRDPTRSYCTCGKALNKNNTTGWCRLCLDRVPRKYWHSAVADSET